MKMPYMFALVLACSAPTVVFVGNAHAGEKEDQLIERITDAYGGDALLNLTNYKIDEAFIAPAGGQSHSPSLTDVGESAQVLVMDLENNRAAYDTWASGRQGGFQSSTVSDGEKAFALNHQTASFGEAGNADAKVFAGGTIRTSDTALVYELNLVKDQATMSEDELYMTRPHHILTMPFPSSPDLKLYIDAETYLLTRMQRQNPQLGSLDYVYTNHTRQDGITYASAMNFSIAGVPNLMSTKHKFTFNAKLADVTFAVPDNLVEEGERTDDSEMQINKISDLVYHIGQNGGYSIFADSGVGVVSAGGYPDIQTRFERFQTESEVFKPLIYQVVTHHHSDHVGGLNEAVALGARLVTVSENISAIKNGTSPEPNDSDFLSISKRATFGEGKNRVEVYEVTTSHAASFLVTYVPADKVVFIADHMGSPFAKATPVANKGTVTMLAALDALDIDIKKIATAHNARIFTMQDMRDSVAAYSPSVCAGNRSVCL